jgi:hypothetical protein
MPTKKDKEISRSIKKVVGEHKYPKKQAIAIAIAISKVESKHKKKR